LDRDAQDITEEGVDISKCVPAAISSCREWAAYSSQGCGTHVPLDAFTLLQLQASSSGTNV
jgi:hypothetical protein